MCNRRLQGDDGASLVENSLLLALIAFVCLAALQFFGSSQAGSVDNSASQITNSN
jgi:Flp pilus assembly pilin Flp